MGKSTENKTNMKKYKPKTKKARCKKVLAIVNNKLSTFDLLREVAYPPVGDFADDPLEMAVIRYEVSSNGRHEETEVQIPIVCVVFVKD